MSDQEKILKEIEKKLGFLLDDFGVFANSYINGKIGNRNNPKNGSINNSNSNSDDNETKSRGTFGIGKHDNDESDIIMGSSIDRSKKSKFIEELLNEKLKELNDTKDELEKASKAYENAKLSGLTGEDLDPLKENLEDILEKYNKLENEADDLKEKLKDTKFSTSVMSAIDGFNEGLKKTTNIVSSIFDGVKKLMSPWAEADKAASKYAKTIGMTKAGMDSLRKSTINNVANSKIASEFNVSIPELLDVKANYAQNLGRNISISDSQERNLAAMHSLMQGRESELIEAFDNFGVNLNGVAEHTGELFNVASKNGISFQKYSENVAKNIKIAQNYTFKNGLKGLESMAKKATAMRMDMSQVASFAEKVSTVEGSIDVASKLQVLGGPFSSLADPLGMLTEGLTDMEGLFDRVVKMVGELGTYDKQSGQVKISAFNQQRIKAAAQAMGIDYTTLTDSASAQARRNEIEKQINSTPSARGLSGDMVELIKNTATINKNGKAVVSIGGEEKEISKLTNSDYQPLIKATQDENKDIKDIASILLSWDESIEGGKKQTEALIAQATENTGIGDGVKNITKLITHSNVILGIIAAAQTVGTIANTITSVRANRFFRGSSGAEGLFKRIGGTGGRAVPRSGNLISEPTGGIITKQTTDTVTKGVAKKAATNKLVGGFGKGAAKNLLKTAGKGAGLGLVLGLAGEGVGMWKDNLLEKGKIKEGNFAHGALTVGENALKGAAIGSILGPWGTAAGAAIGAAVGGVKMAKLNREKALDNKLSEKGIEKKGEYGAWGLKRINNALDDGKISRRLRRKLERQGDSAILAQIDAKKKEKDEEREAKKDRRAERWGKIFGGGNNSISKGTINIDTAYINSKKILTGTEKGIEKKSLKGASIGSILLGPLGTVGGAEKGIDKKGKYDALTNRKKALKGAEIESILGPFGTAIGGAIGLISVKKKQKNEKIVDTQLEKLGIERRGNYGSRSLGLIDKALQTGEVSDRMRKKLLANGDTELLDAINKKKTINETENNKENEIKEKVLSIANATISIGNADINQNNKNERLLYNNIGLNAVEEIKGRYNKRFNILNTYKNTVSDLLLPLTFGFKAGNYIGKKLDINKGVQNIKPKPEDGSSPFLSYFRGLSKKEKEKHDSAIKMQEENVYNKNLSDKIEINISGTLKLIGTDGKNTDLSDKLISELTKSITKQLYKNRWGTNRQDNNVLFKT